MDVINTLIQQFGYKRYLEIGTETNQCFNAINCENKVGVDPDPLGDLEAIYRMTSDKFFAQHKETFDIVFIDGLHHEEQVYRDILNSLEVLSEGGTIVCHDMNPLGFKAQYVPRKVERWNGDCWRAWVRLRTEREDLEMFVLKVDEGIGIIRRGKQERLVLTEEMDYDSLVKNRYEWLNLQPISYFLERVEQWKTLGIAS